MEAVLHMLMAFTRDERYEEIEEEIMENVKKGEVITLCDFAEKMEKKGMKRGVKQGVKQANRLVIILAKAGRNDDIVKAARDPEYQEKLFQEFGI
ncbi:MAG: hypothetical protein PHV18_04585 [Lachnospiraceae bacterium]|nr:hypothetical protein [Lachnospiraceae bacterium]